MARYCQNLITLEVAACSNLTDGSFYTLAAACFRLERMDLEECIHITDNTLLQLSIHCPHIKGKIYIRGISISYNVSICQGKL